MKAIINNGITYKVTGERGAFTISEDIKGKIKMFQTSTIEIVDAPEFGKPKVYYKSKSTKVSADTLYQKQDLHDAKYKLGRYKYS